MQNFADRFITRKIIDSSTQTLHRKSMIRRMSSSLWTKYQEWRTKVYWMTSFLVIYNAVSPEHSFFYRTQALQRWGRSENYNAVSENGDKALWTKKKLIYGWLKGWTKTAAFLHWFKDLRWFICHLFIFVIKPTLIFFNVFHICCHGYINFTRH